MDATAYVKKISGNQGRPKNESLPIIAIERALVFGSVARI
jgi:hypothetical protein|tara:strand:- start:57 stop:176 length:120 start_codon:yes stop_codon:yes gene_type:complete